jgi:hypothetical protein
MAFDNSERYPNRKDWRQPYRRGAKRFDRGCRHGGHCSICRDNRLHKAVKPKVIADEKLREATAAQA